MAVIARARTRAPFAVLLSQAHVVGSWRTAIAPTPTTKALNLISRQPLSDSQSGFPSAHPHTITHQFDPTVLAGKQAATPTSGYQVRLVHTP